MGEVLDKLFFVLLGAAIAWAIAQYRLSRSEDLALVNEHIKDIEKLSEAAQQYWLKVPADLNSELELAGKVKASHAATTLLYERMTTVCRKQSSEEYVQRYFELFSVATGGAFESFSRASDPLRAIQTADVAARIVHLLRLERSDIVSGSRARRIIVKGCREFWFPPPSRQPWLRWGADFRTGRFAGSAARGATFGPHGEGSTPNTRVGSIVRWLAVICGRPRTARGQRTSCPSMKGERTQAVTD